MPTIQRDALHAFVDRQLLKIESTPIPPELTGLGAAERLQADEIQALWFGAGIASQIGMVLAMDKTDAHCEMMSTLFTFLFAEGVIAGQQFDIGFQRVKEVGIVTACACTTARSLAGVCRSVTDTVVLRASVCVFVCVCV